MRLTERVLPVLLAVAVGFSPLAPAFATPAEGQTPSHPAHDNGVAGAADNVRHAHHGNAGATADADGLPANGCLLHDQCSGTCCAVCAQCLVAVLGFPAFFSERYSFQFPTVTRLLDRLTVAAHNRPPAV